MFVAVQSVVTPRSHREETGGDREIKERYQVHTGDSRRHTAWMDIKTWTGLTMEESVRMAKDRDKWRKYVNYVANLLIDDG